MPAILEIGPTTVVQAINFCVLLGVLKFVLYDPLRKVVQEREKKVKDDLDEAESINERAKMLKEDYEEKLKSARQEAADLYQKTMAEAERVRGLRLKAVEGELSTLRRKAMDELRMEKDKIAEELRRQAGGLAVEIASKLLKGALRPELHQSLVQDFIKQVKEKDATG